MSMSLWTALCLRWLLNLDWCSRGYLKSHIGIGLANEITAQLALVLTWTDSASDCQMQGSSIHSFSVSTHVVHLAHCAGHADPEKSAAVAHPVVSQNITHQWPVFARFGRFLDLLRRVVAPVMTEGFMQESASGFEAGTVDLEASVR